VAASSPWFGKRLFIAIYNATVRWRRARARRLLSVPEGHILLKATERDNGGPGRMLAGDATDRQLISYYKSARRFERSITTNYEQYSYRARQQGMTWQDNAKAAYAAYETEVWAFAGVRAIAQSAAGIRWEFYRPVEGDDEKREPFSNFITERLLDSPNPDESWPDFVEAVMSYNELTGMGLWDRSARIAGGRLLQGLRSIDPACLFPVGNADELIAGWTYTDPWGKETPIDKEAIGWYRAFRPGTARLGIGSIQPAGAAVDESAAIRMWSTAFFDNNAEPSGWIELDKVMHGSLMDTLREEWRKIHRPGSHEVGILPKGATYNQSTSGTGRKGDFLDVRKVAMREISAGLGVPPVMLGDTDSVNYSNAEQQKEIFWQNTELPKILRFSRAMTQQVCPLIAPGVRFGPVMDSIPYIDPGKAERQKRWLEEVREGLLSEEEYRERMGYGAKDEAHTFHTPPMSGVLPAPALTESDDDPPTGSGSPPPDTPPPPADGDEDGVEAPAVIAPRLPAAQWGEEEKAGHTATFGARQMDYATSIVTATAPVWAAQRDRVLEMLDGGLKLAKREARIVRAARIGKSASLQEMGRARRQVEKEMSLDELMGALTEEDLAKLVQVIQRQGLDIMVKDGQWALETHWGEVPPEFSIGDAIVSDWMDHSNNAMGGAMDTARKRLMTSLSRGLIKGEGLRDLRLRVESVYTQMSQSHATMVARTETAAAQNRGIIEGYAIGGAAGKAWLTMRDGNTRSSHESMEGVVADVRGVFMVNGFAMQHPGDFNAPFSETHNCRCTTIPVVRDLS